MSSKKSKLLESAQKNIQKGQYDRAIREYEEIVNLDPADIRHRQKLAELLAKVNRKDEAVKEYQTLAKHYEDLIHYVKAIAVYKQIQKLDPTNPDVSLTLADLNVKQGLIGNAIAEYNSALQIYENNQENRKALKVLESLLSLDPRNAAIRMRIAEKCFTIGEEAKSLELFAALARDLKENGDDNGYERVADRMRAIFPQQSAVLLSEMEEVFEPEPEVFVPAPELRSPPPELRPPPPPPFAPAEERAKLEVAPTPPAPELSKPPEEEIEPIEDIDEIEELAEEMESPAPGIHEWEEEIDLGSLDDHDFGVETAEFVALQPETDLELPELDLTELAVDEILLEDLELEEIELELEIEPEIEAEVEPLFLPVTAAIAEQESFAEIEPDTFDLAGELALFADELDFTIPQGGNSEATFDAGLAEMFKTNELDREDAESHYSLGLAYKEMGLYEEAISEFEVAANSPARRIDSLLLQGLCHRDNDDLPEAEKILTSLLQEPSISEDELLSVKYELAACHEITGEKEIARRLFTEIVTIRPGFSDAASRLENL